MFKNFKTDFQKIHYNKKAPNTLLTIALGAGEFFYKNIIKIKNFLYEKNILKEKKVNAYVICVGNLTTGGVGKTPIVAELANEISKEKKVAIISRGYGAKISNKKPLLIKSDSKIMFENGTLCGDEPYQLAKKVKKDVVIITCADRKKAADYAIIKFGAQVIILDDGFSNRKIKKDKIFLVIDSKMRFGNNHLLPFGPLREPVDEIKRAQEIILVNKGDENLDDAIKWAKNEFSLPLRLSEMFPYKIYNAQTKAEVKLNNKCAIAFCAIGQPEQFFGFARKFYDIKQTIAFEDHHKYNKNDIKNLIAIAKENKINSFITTQKDETKLLELIENINGFSFNVLELKTTIQEIN